MDQNLKQRVNLTVNTDGVAKVLNDRLSNPNNPVISSYMDDLSEVLNKQVQTSTITLKRSTSLLDSSQAKLESVVNNMNDVANDVKTINKTSIEQSHKLLGISVGLLVVGLVLTLLGLYNMVICNVWKAPLLHSMLSQMWGAVGTVTGFGKVITFIFAVIVSVLIVGVPLALPLGLAIVYYIGYRKDWW